MVRLAWLRMVRLRNVAFVRPVEGHLVGVAAIIEPFARFLGLYLLATPPAILHVVPVHRYAISDPQPALRQLPWIIVT